MDPLKQGSGHVRTILPLDEPIALPPDVLVEQRGAELLEAPRRTLERREDRLALVDLQAEGPRVVVECAAEPVAGWIVTDRQRDLHERLSLPEALRSRSDLAELGAAAARRRRGVPRTTVIVLPGCSRPMVRVSDYRDLAASSTYRDDRVRA